MKTKLYNYLLIVGLLVTATIHAASVTATANFEASTATTANDRISGTATTVTVGNVTTGSSNASWSDLTITAGTGGGQDQNCLLSSSSGGAGVGMTGNWLLIGNEGNTSTADDETAITTVTMNLTNPIKLDADLSINAKLAMIGAGGQVGYMAIIGKTATGTELFRIYAGNGRGPGDTSDLRWDFRTANSDGSIDALAQDVTSGTPGDATRGVTLTISDDASGDYTLGLVSAAAGSPFSIAGKYFTTGDLAKIEFRCIASKAEWGIDDISVVGEAGPLSIPEKDIFATEKNTTLSGANVLDNDTNELAAAPVVVTPPSHATSFAIAGDGVVTYVPELDWTGTDSFTYSLDGKVTSVSVVVYDAAVNTYVGPAGGSINDVANWSIALPSASNPGVIDIGSDQTVSGTGTHGGYFFNIKSGVVDLFGDLAPDTIEVSGGILNVDDNDGWDFGGGLIVLTAGTMNVDLAARFRGGQIDILDGNLIFEPSISDHRFFGDDDQGSDIYLKDGGTGTVTAATGINVVRNPGKCGFNFEEGFLGKIDLNNVTFENRFNDGFFKINGVAATDNAGVMEINGQDFSECFDVNGTELELDPNFTPVFGIEVTQNGTELSWLVEAEVNVKEYQIINAETGELIDTVVAGNKNYTCLLEDGVTAQLVVIDNSGFQQTFYPENGNEQITNYDLVAGWNLVAITAENVDLSPLKKASQGELWSWDGTGYIVAQNLKPTDAVWVYVTDAKQVQLKGDKSSVSLELNQGWNLVGPTVNCPVPASALTVYTWSSLYENVLSDNILLKGVGYWIFKL